MFDATFARPRRRGTLTLSIGFHAVLGAALVVGPLAAVEEPSEPSVQTVCWFPSPPNDEPIRVKLVTEKPAGGRKPAADAPRNAVARPGTIAEPSRIPDTVPAAGLFSDENQVIGPVDAPERKGNEPATDSPVVDMPPGDDEEPIYRVDKVTEPVPVFNPSPAYPDLARRIHAEGVVILEAIIGRDGHVRDVRVLRGVNPLLDKAALDAVLQWTYEPARIGKRAVSVYLTVTVRFGLTR